MKMKYIIFCLLFILPLAACNRYENIKKWPDPQDNYDSSKPAAFDVLKPTFGGINKNFVVEGNFPGELSDMEVYFGDKKAVLISTDGHTISGLVPKLLPGVHAVSVVVKGETLTNTAPEDNMFKYSQTRSISVVAGALGVNDRDKDGDLNTGRFGEVTGIEAIPGVNGDNVWVSCAWWGNKTVKLVSLDDNMVTKISSAYNYGSPAATPDRETLYAVGCDAGDHVITTFSRVNGWTPRQTGIKIAQNDMNRNVWDCAFMGDNTRYLFVMDVNAYFARVDLLEGNYVMLNRTGQIPQSFFDRAHFTWSDYHNCFFASMPEEHGIYKVVFDEATMSVNFEKYAGFNGNADGFKAGHRLNEARIRNPYGICVDNTGDIYITSRGGHFVCRIRGDFAELVAGRPNTRGLINGDPLEARLDQPQDICPDFEGNFFIAGGYDRTVRKLTIE